MKNMRTYLVDWLLSHCLQRSLVFITLFWLCRVQVLKLCTFWFMHQECQAFEQLLDWKKRFPINLTGYDSFLLSKEQRHEKYKECMAAYASNLKTLDQTVVPMEYDIIDVHNVSLCDSGNVVASVSLDNQNTELWSVSFDKLRAAVQSISCEEQCVTFEELRAHFEMGTSVQNVILNDQLASVLPLTSDLTYVELELSDFLGQYSADESFAIDTSDHAYAAMNQSVSDHVYSAAPISSEHQNQKLLICVHEVRKHVTVKKRKLSKRKTIAHSHILKAMKWSCKCIVTKACNMTI